MILGAPTWIFSTDEPLDRCIRRIASAGAKGVELIIWNDDTIREQFTARGIADIRALLADQGLRLTQLVVPAKAAASEDPRQRDDAVALFRRCTDVGAALGTDKLNFTSPYPFACEFPSLHTLPTVSTFSMDARNMDRDWDRNLREYAETVGRFCDIAVEHGMQVLVEPHPFRWVKDTDSFLTLHQLVGKPNFKINYDTNHTFPCGELPQVAPYRLRDRIAHVHVSDNDGLFNAHWVPGKGKIDWREFLRALAAVGYDGAVSFEICEKSLTEARLGELRECIRLFTALCGELGIELE